jgi:hypothetical protein
VRGARSARDAVRVTAALPIASNPWFLPDCSPAIDSTKVPASMVLAAAMKRLDGLCCAIGYIPQVYWVRLNPERP